VYRSVVKETRRLFMINATFVLQEHLINATMTVVVAQSTEVPLQIYLPPPPQPSLNLV
jgi:hypothetical protein